jgi:DNA helicase II / ATP-dependent DNA helicase PcrA
MYQNICVVGDDAQSIYAFRGATIQNIINFNRDYPSVRTFKLEQNYRSSKHIVEAANKIISKNNGQIKKDIWTDNGEGEKIKVTKTISESEEAKMVANTIFANKNRYQMYNKDFAILYRTNSQSRAFEEQLRKLNIPYIIYGGTSFYQRKEIKDLVAYLKLAVNPYEEESMRRIINYPARAIGETTVQRAALYGKENGMKLWDVMQQIHLVPDLQNRAKVAISEFVTMMQYFIMMQKDKNAYDLAFLIAKDTKLSLELHNDKSVEGVNRYENLQELLNGIKEFTEEDVIEEDQEMSIDRSLGAFLQNITLLTDQDKTDENADNVKMMTIHASKGLEFKDVFVVGMEEGLFPSSMALNDRDGLEEERRLFYVAVTRAEQRVSISFAMSRYKFGQIQYGEQSRFIEDMPHESLEMVGFDKAQIDPLDIDFEDDLRPTSFKSFGPSKLQKTIIANQRKPSKEDVENFIPDDFNKLQAGMNVRHMLFGNGLIKAIEGSGEKKIAVIQFDSEGEKKIMLKFAKLKIES